MRQPNPSDCPFCGGHEWVEARLEGAMVGRLAVDADHVSQMLARVCMACGHVRLVATEPGNLRTGEEQHRDVQEHDF